MLVCMQTIGAWEVNAAHLRSLRDQAAGLLSSFEWWDVRQVPREENKIADRLSNEAVDERSERVTTWYSEVKDDEERTSDGGSGRQGGMRTKRLSAEYSSSSNGSIDEIILPIKRHRQG